MANPNPYVSGNAARYPREMCHTKVSEPTQWADPNFTVMRFIFECYPEK